MHRQPIYKLLTEAEWLAAETAGQTASAVDLADGYVHLSTRAQLTGTAERYFAGKGRVRLLEFDSGVLSPLRWEPSRGGDLFPHLYGPLEIRLAEAACWIVPDADGHLVVPEDI